MKRFLTLAVVCMAMMCLALSAISEDAGYTVEFTRDGLEYVIPGDTSVAMPEILSTFGLTGEVTAVEVSDASLFSASDETGEWIVTALQPFSTTEWMKVTINGVVYEITVTDTTISFIDISGTDYTLFTGFTATGGSTGVGVFTYGKAVDGDMTSSWHDQSSGVYVEFNTDDPIIPKGYILNTYQAGSFYPQAWVLKAKANTTDGWTTLSSYSGQTLSSGQEFQYACNNDGNTAYKYFRFEASNTNNNIWLTEIRLYGSSPDVYYTHLTKKDATCTETGIKQNCYLRNDGKYFTDETGTTELAESDVIDPIKPHTGEHHDATEVNIEYWQCSMCSKYFSDEGCTTEITEEQTKIYRTITIDGSISGLVTSNVNQALAGATVTLTVSHLIDASTLKVNNGAVELTDIGSNHYTFTVPADNVTVTAETLSTYSFSLPDNMEIVSATNEADGNGKYISGTVITFAPSLRYSASNVSDGTNTLEPDANGVYTVTIENANINITATVVGSSTLYLAGATSDFTAADGETLVGSTSHTVAIANGANITLNNATITGGIVCEGTATITLDGTNSVSVVQYKKAGIQIGGSGTTLTIRGDGSLTATGGSAAAGIGLGRTWDASVTAGAIVIEGVTVNASGDIGIGIGTVGNSQTATIDGISIKGGTVNASLGKGNIYYGSTATVGYIKIYDTIDMVDASKITETVTYMHVDGESATDVTADKTDYFTIGENGDRRIIVPKDDTDYTITIAEGIEHGTITGAATAKYMETVTINATPDFGYRLVRLVVKDADDNDVASTGNTFLMPKSNVTVSAVFEQGTHGTTEFTWLYSTGPAPQDQVRETIYDGVTTVNIQQKEISYNIWKYNEYTYSQFRLDNDTYEANIPYAGGTGEFYETGNATNFSLNYDGETGYYDITLTDVGNGKWGVSILPTAAQMDVVPDQTYTGSAITPEPLVIAGSLSLTKGEDYTYSYENNINVGTATVRATFQGDYESLGYVEKTFTIKPSTIMVNVTGSGTVTIGDKSASNGEAFGVMSEKGASVVLTLAPESGNTVRSVEYGYTNSKGTNRSGAKLPISDGTATLTVPNDLKDGTGVTLTVTFAAALVGGADEDSAVALTDNSVTDLAGGWYKVTDDITFDHTLNLLGDTHLTIADGKTMTVSTATSMGIDSDYTLNVGGAGALSVTASGSYQIAVRVGSYVQTGATVTASGFIGIRCCDDFDADVTNDLTFSGGQLTVTGTSDGIWADNTITISCTNGSDFIKASSYSGTISVADGKVLTDGTATSDGLNSYSGTLTSDEITAIAGKTLHSAYTVTFAAGYENPTGTMDPVIIECGTEYTLPTSGFTAQGKTFSSWSVVIGTAEAMTKAVGDPITVTANTTVTAVWEDIGLKIVQNTLELDAVLNLKYYLSVPQDFDGNGASMTFSLNSQSIPFSSASQSGEYYVFPCRVYAYQMAEPITATFTWQENGETKTLIDTYSVKQYLDTLATDTNTNAKTLALVEAVQNYGHYLQPYLARINGLTYTEMPKADTVVDVSTATSGSVEQANKIAHNTTLDGSMITNLQIRLNINSGTSLMFEFKLADGVSGTVTAMAGGDNFTDVTPNGNGVYRISKQTIAANNLECASSFAVNVGDVLALTTTASVMDYISLALTNSDQNDEKLALAALYEYWAAADSYQ